MVPSANAASSAFSFEAHVDTSPGFVTLAAVVELIVIPARTLVTTKRTTLPAARIRTATSGGGLRSDLSLMAIDAGDVAAMAAISALAGAEKIITAPAIRR